VIAQFKFFISIEFKIHLDVPNVSQQIYLLHALNDLVHNNLYFVLEVFSSMNLVSHIG